MKSLIMFLVFDWAIVIGFCYLGYSEGFDPKLQSLLSLVLTTLGLMVTVYQIAIWKIFDTSWLSKESNV